MTSRIDQAMQFNQTAINLRAYRQQVIASNIANADTANYKARDIDFKQTLSAAMSARGGNAVSLSRTSTRHLSAPGQAGKTEVLYRNLPAPNGDGNTVNMDIERAAFAENAVHLEALIAFINLDLRMQQSAIQTP